jgi:hypothetical protein
MSTQAPTPLLLPPSDDGYALDAPPAVVSDSLPNVVATSGAPGTDPQAVAGAGTPASPPSAAPSKPAVSLLAALLGRFQRKAQPAPPMADSQAAGASQPNGQATMSLRGRKRRSTRSWLHDLPAWGVSTIVHVTIFCVLAMGTFAPQIHDALVKSIDSAPFNPAVSAEQGEELLHILADPSAAERDQAVGPLATSSEPSGPNYSAGLGTGSGAPSATPALRGRGAGSSGGVGEGALPNVRGGSVRLSPVVSMLPRVASRDLGGRGGVSGDVTGDVKSIGEALDQMAREILRHLQDHKLTVVWLFDESGSMRDDQQAIKEKFDHVASALKDNVNADMKSSAALTHVIVGFGANTHFELPKPTPDIDAIGRAIDRLPIDESGIENTMQTLQRVIGEYARLISKDRKLLIVLVTDESGDDGAQVEEARLLAKKNGVPIYVIGRQSVFGYETVHLLYTDPVTKDTYWPSIRRGPETPIAECLQYDGLHDRWDEQAAGFGPYELARLVKETGGIYFLLPSEEGTRVRQREQAYSMKTLREYVPDYKSRMDYIKQRQASELRRTLFEIVELTRSREAETTFLHRREFPVEESPLVEAMLEEAPKVQGRLKLLIDIEKKLRSIENLRDREPDKRWQAHYDLILAQVVTYQVKAYEYLACMDEMVDLGRKGQLKPTRMPVAGQLDVVWLMEHSTARKAPKEETEKKYIEAERLLKLVIERHPNTPWADLAKDEMTRGFGVTRVEWSRSPQYAERARLVPKY